MDFFKKAKAGIKDAQDVAKMLGIDKMNLGDKNKSDSAAPATAAAPAAASPPYAPTPASNGGGSAAPPVANAAATTPAHAGSVVTDVTPSANPNAPKKLPMMARKSIRDDFDSKKPELEAKLSKLLGTPWTVFVDAANVYSYTADAEATWPRDNPGGMFTRYYEDSFHYIERFAQKNGADGVAQLNSLASGHVMTFEPATEPHTKPYCYCDISGGKLRMLFVPKHLGVNPGNALEYLSEVVNSTGSGGAEGAALTLAARSSIRNEYDTKIEEIKSESKRQLKADYDLIFVPNFEDTFAKLKAHISKLDDEDKSHPFVDNFDTFIGRAVLSYFEGFSSYVKYKGFRKDDMMQEAFADAVDKHEIVFRIDDSIPDGKRNDCVIEDGRLILRTKLDQFYCNTDDASRTLVDLL